MSLDVWLVGTLADHRRGKIFRDLLFASPNGSSRNGPGIHLLFGSDFQDGSPDEQSRWAGLPDAAGRTLLLVPPLKLGSWSRPSPWSVEGLTGPSPAGVGTLPSLLVPEVRHRIDGVLQYPNEPEGRWSDGSAHTGFSRRRPNSGIFAITCLPLWSASLLGRRAELSGWLERLHDLAGLPATSSFQPVAEPTLSPEHHAVMLHLCQTRSSDRTEVLSRLATSSVFSIDPSAAGALYDDLEIKGLASNGHLTSAGHEALRSGPFSAYYEAFAEEVR